MLLLGNDRWALMHEMRGDGEPSLDSLLGRMRDCDLILVEGFKNGHFPKLEVWRPSLGKPMLWPDWPGIVAIASNAPLQELSDTALIAAFILLHARER